MHLINVGTIAFDSVETPFGKRDEGLGGSATYLSTAAAFLTRPGTVAIIGDDFPPHELERLAARGIDLAGVVRHSGRTFRWRGYYGENLNEAHTLETQLNVLEAFDPQLPAAYRQCPFVMLGNIDPKLQHSIIDQLEAPRLIACDTMNFWLNHSRASLESLLPRVHMLMVNDAEARSLADCSDLNEAARIIRAQGPQTLIIKRGEHGATLFDAEGSTSFPAYSQAQAQDPTGAGDSFAGGFMSYLARQNSTSPQTMREAVAVGSVIASFTVEGFSTERLDALTLNDVQQRLTRYCDSAPLPLAPQLSAA